MASIISLPQHHGAFSTLRLTSPVQESSNSLRILRPHLVHSKVGIKKLSDGSRNKSCARWGQPS